MLGVLHIKWVFGNLCMLPNTVLEENMFIRVHSMNLGSLQNDESYLDTAEIQYNITKAEFLYAGENCFASGLTTSVAQLTTQINLMAFPMRNQATLRIKIGYLPINFTGALQGAQD